MKGSYSVDHKLTEVIFGDKPNTYGSPWYVLHENEIMKGGKTKVKNPFMRFCNRTGGGFFKR